MPIAASGTQRRTRDQGCSDGRNTLTSRQRLEAHLIERAIKDEEFRQALVRDPTGVFKQELGITMPEHIHVQVLEESPVQAYLVLPQVQTSASAELSDEELESVAGGWTSDTCDTAGKGCIGTCG